MGQPVPETWAEARPGVRANYVLLAAFGLFVGYTMLQDARKKRTRRRSRK